VPVARAIQIMVVVGMFWAFLFVIGKAPAPDRGRLEQVGQAAHDLAVGSGQTVGEAASRLRAGDQGGVSGDVLPPGQP
jgi:hypothetical protein